MVALENITNTVTNPGAFSGWGAAGIVFPGFGRSTYTRPV